MIIAIVDDDHIWIKRASDILQKYAQGRLLPLEILSFDKGKDFLTYQGDRVDAVLLDIELSGESGIELAARINERWKDCQIVFCTDYIHYAMDVYETEHSYFLVKEHMEEFLEKVMTKISRTINEKRQEIFYHVIRAGMTRFHIKDILYFERKTRYTLLVTQKGEYNIREKISEIIPDLPEGEFTRCHASFLIKLSYVEKKDGPSYQLCGGEVVPISRKYLTSTKKEYLHWCERQMM